MKQGNLKALWDQLEITKNSLVYSAARAGILLCRFQQVLLVLPVGRADCTKTGRGKQIPPRAPRNPQDAQLLLEKSRE